MVAVEVPWAINHSRHSARLARVAHQQNVGTGSGVSRPADLKVVPLNTPGNGFRVMPGGGAAQSRYTDVSARESYAPLVNEVLEVTGIEGVGSGQTRRDLIILEITDPEMTSLGYDVPTDAEFTGEWQLGETFCRVTVITGVDDGVTSLDQITTGPYAHVTGITLAAINWPAGPWDVVTTAYIEDLRTLQSPRTLHVPLMRPFSGSEEDVLTATAAAGQVFPAVGADLWGAVDIPKWATGAHVKYLVFGLLGSNAQSYGDLWVRVGTGALRIESSRFDFPAGAGVNRMTYGAVGTVAIPAEMRGTAQRFYPMASKNSNSASTSKVSVDANSSILLEVDFFESLA